MLQAANTDHFNPLVPKADRNECHNLLFPLQIKPVNCASQLKLVCGFLFFAPSAPMGTYIHHHVPCSSIRTIPVYYGILLARFSRKFSASNKVE